MPLRITVSASDPALAFEKAKRLGERARQKAVKATAQRLFEHARRMAMRHNKTGRLVRSLYLRETDGTWRVGHDLRVAKYAKWVHDGSRPHVILPKRGKALRWMSGGKAIFAKKVNHPGYKGDPYLRDAARNAPRWFHENVRLYLTKNRTES
jgi:hypothetical protein